MGIEEILTAPRSPWQNPFVERLIGTLRRELLDHVIVLNERHLMRLLRSFFAYYHEARTHQSLDNNAPNPREVEGLEQGEVVSVSMVGACTTAIAAAPDRAAVHESPNRDERSSHRPRSGANACLQNL